MFKLKHLTQFFQCNFLLLGDYNARIGDQCDYVATDSSSHVHYLPDDYVTDQELPRKSVDKIVNANGHMLLDFLKQSGLRIANGRVCNSVGSYTYVGSAGCSSIDYCIVNPDILNCFSSFHVYDPNILSDHCLIEFSLKVPY